MQYFYYVFCQTKSGEMEIYMKEEKTNVMRILDSKKIMYKSYNYTDSGAISGIEVAAALNQYPDLFLKL